MSWTWPYTLFKKSQPKWYWEYVLSTSSKEKMTLKGVFQKYAAFGRPGQCKDITSKNFSKMMKECDIMDKKVNQTEIDIIPFCYRLMLSDSECN